MELLHAIQAKDLTRTLALLEQPGTDAAYEDYKEGTWGARDRQSPIHAALFNLKSEGKQWRDGVMALMRKGADVNAKFEVRELSRAVWPSHQPFHPEVRLARMRSYRVGL